MFNLVLNFSLLLFSLLFIDTDAPNLSVLHEKDAIRCTSDDTVMVSIYPNPLDGDKMFLKTQNETGIITFYSDAGDKILREDFEAGTNEYDISKIKPGTYKVSIVTDGSMSIAKFDICRW